MCSEQEPLTLFKGLQMGIFGFFTERDWNQKCCHGNNTEGVIVSFGMYIFGAKFEEHCSNISGDILDSVFYCSTGTIYDVITSLICIMQKRKYL